MFQDRLVNPLEPVVGRSYMLQKKVDALTALATHLGLVPHHAGNSDKPRQGGVCRSDCAVIYIDGGLCTSPEKVGHAYIHPDDRPRIPLQVLESLEKVCVVEWKSLGTGR
jgi:hypothetical protein